MFNQHFSRSLKGRARDSVIQTIARSFFRIRDVRYLLCGLDDNTEFGVEIPDLTSWWKTWRFRELIAVPDLASQRGQCIVKFNLVLEKRESREPLELPYHTDIRW